ncbi:hypothetical protein WAB17_07530 [Parerythrobacter aurantius]|uniref:hypothetical protein n=1 Tax=Parerythrobacter aurantius TaxID=3127706 RepID=UPI003245AB42
MTRKRPQSKQASAPAASFQPEPAAAPQLPAHPPEPPASRELDAHGFDPADYDWLPVTRKPRKDGWSPSRQREFIAALAESGSVEVAAMRVHMSPSSAHRLRRSPGAEQFSAAWDVALQHAAQVLLDTAFERAFNGTTEPVFDRDGHHVGTRHRQNDRMLMFLLRAYMPERFRHAHRDWRSPGEQLPPPPVSMEQALAQMAPVPPAEPHSLMAPDELEDVLQCAEILDGKLPGWREGATDTMPAPLPDVERETEYELLKAGVERDSDGNWVPGPDYVFE